MACTLDGSTLVLPDKSTLCMLRHTAINSFYSFGVVLLPDGACEAFDETPGHVLVSGDEDCVKSMRAPLYVVFKAAEKRPDGVIFRFQQSATSTVYAGYVQADQICTGANEFASLDNNSLTWVAMSTIASLSEVVNGDGAPLLTNTNKALNAAKCMRVGLGCISAQKIAAFCAAGNYSKNLQKVWTQAIIALRGEHGAGKALTAAATAAMKEDEKALEAYVQRLMALAPFYDLPLSKRIVVINPIPPEDYDSAAVLAKLKGLLQHFPNNEAITQAGRFPAILEALNTGRGSLSIPTPVRYQLRSAASSPAKAAAPSPAQPSPKSGVPESTAKPATPKPANAKDADSVDSDDSEDEPIKSKTRGAGNRKATVHFKPDEPQSNKKAKTAEKPSGTPKAKAKTPKKPADAQGDGRRGQRGSYKENWLRKALGADTDSPLELHRGGDKPGKSDPGLALRVKELECEVKTLKQELASEKASTQLQIDKAVSEAKLEMQKEVRQAWKEGSDYVKGLYKELRA